MTDIPEKTNDSGQQQGTPTPSQAENSDHMIPKQRLDEVIQERNKLRELLEAQSVAEKEAQATKLAEQNEYKQLYEQTLQELEQLKPLQEQATRYQSALQATNQARLERIPEDKRTLVPEYDDPVKLGAWLDTNLPLLAEQSAPKPPKTDGGAGVSSGSKQGALSADTQSVADIARSYGIPVNEERIAKFASNPIIPTDMNKKDE